jgi:hypothetical protein
MPHLILVMDTGWGNSPTHSLDVDDAQGIEEGKGAFHSKQGQWCLQAFRTNFHLFRFDDSMTTGR